MAFRIKDRIEEGTSNEFQAVGYIIAVFYLDIDAFHDAAQICLTDSQPGIHPAFLALRKKVLLPVFGDEEAWSDLFFHCSQCFETAFRQYADRPDKRDVS